MNREQSRFKPDEIKFLTLFTYTNDVLNQKMKDVVNEYARSDENKAKSQVGG